MIEKTRIMEFTKYPKAIAASLLGLSIQELSDICKTHGKRPKITIIKFLFG